MSENLFFVWWRGAGFQLNYCYSVVAQVPSCDHEAQREDQHPFFFAMNGTKYCWTIDRFGCMYVCVKIKPPLLLLYQGIDLTTETEQLSAGFLHNFQLKWIIMLLSLLIGLRRRTMHFFFYTADTTAPLQERAI